MICPKCNKSNLPQAETCITCGTLLHGAVFPSALSSIPPETILAASPSITNAPAAQKPGCLGSFLKRVFTMAAAIIVGWLCGLVNAVILPTIAQTLDSAWLVTLAMSGTQMCLSFLIALALGISFRRKIT